MAGQLLGLAILFDLDVKINLTYFFSNSISCNVWDTALFIWIITEQQYVSNHHGRCSLYSHSESYFHLAPSSFGSRWDLAAHRFTVILFTTWIYFWLYNLMVPIIQEYQLEMLSSATSPPAGWTSGWTLPTTLRSVFWKTALLRMVFVCSSWKDLNRFNLLYWGAAG